MAVDQYAMCPCGSGKKIKFCKCVDSIGEIDKVMKMVSGGQVVAAIDRLNQVLQQFPTAAWALAIKGRLLINLSELSALAENADRFIRLQPSNPLALAQKAASLVFTNQTVEGARAALEALAESRHGIDPFLLEVASILAMALVRERRYFSARYFAALPLMVDDFEDASIAQQVLRELNESRALNSLLKTVPQVLDRPENVTWGERFDEAQSLLLSQQVLTAESKLEALDRQYSMQPAILSGLLVCAIWRADTDAQSRLLEKLADAAEDEESAARYLATSYLVDPKMTQLMTPMYDMTFEVTETETLTIAFAGSPLMRGVPSELLRDSVPSPDDVPPKAGFQLLDRELPDVDSLESAEQFPVSLGTALVFGRQTDRAPRVEFIDILPDDRTKICDLMQQHAGIDKPTAEEARNLSFTNLALPRIIVPPNLKQTTERAALIDQVFQQAVPENILGACIPASGNQPIETLISNPKSIRIRTALVRILQGSHDLRLLVNPALVAIETKLQVPSLAMFVPESDEDVEQLTAFDLVSVDTSKLEGEALYYLFQRAMQVSCTPTIRLCSEKLIKIDAVDEDSKEMVYRAYSALMQVAQSPEEALQFGQQAKQWCAAAKVSDAQIMLNEIYRHLELGDPGGFEKTVQAIVTKHGKDQNVMAHLQQLLIQVGVLNPDGSTRRANVPQPKSSGLWTGGAEPVDTPAADASSGGSKLWLPGMD